MRSIVRVELFLCSFLLSVGARAAPQQYEFTTGERATSLLELYTSEGCSSCPPAEEWLSGLKKSPDLWKRFVPVAFHVDYWDYLGWRDPWGTEAFSDRQRQYANTWKTETIYTPEFVVNGREWRGFGESKVPQPNRKPGVLAVSSTDGRIWTVTFQGAAKAASYEVHGAVLASELTSAVKAGENRGRILAHDFVVVSLAHKALNEKAGAWHGEFDLKRTTAEEKGRGGVAFWITDRATLVPLQAVGGWLK